MSTNTTETRTSSSTDTAQGSTTSNSPSNSPTSSTVTSPDQSQSSNSSTLYLFTFLATLFVLLLISSSIAFRSFVLRRRFRRGYERALADGLVTDIDGATLAGGLGIDGLGGVSGRSRGGVKLGAKPLLWETWVQRPSSHVDSRSEKRTKSDAHTHLDEKQSKSPVQTGTNNPPEEQLNINLWPQIKPVALHITRSCPAPPLPSSCPSSPSSPEARQEQFPTLLSRLRFQNPFSRSSQPPRSEHGACNNTELAGGPCQSDSSGGRDVGDPKDVDAFAASKAHTVSVSVLIAMPDVVAPALRPSMHTSHERGEDGGKGKDALDSHSEENHSEAYSYTSLQQGSGVILDATEDAVGGFPIVEFGVMEVRAVGIGEEVR
ncbi:hypothetical protein BS17DRAFT_789921 [Gyrodon lividus]|nr:hypothetical protein BS17DRAFT_789921 [Gyrodon lividus]